MKKNENMDNIVAIVQARLGSSRLQLKSLLCLRDHAIIDWVAKRLAKAKSLNRIVFAVPDVELDNVLAEHLERHGFTCIRGSENDVLARFVKAARQTEASHVVRICADNPLVWGEAIDRLVDFYRNGDYDYAYNHIPRNNLWPDGLGAEIISADLLYELDQQAQKTSQREHCLNYIWDNSQNFAIGTFDPSETWLRRPDIKLDIDNLTDFERLSELSLSPDSEAEEIISAWDKAGHDA